jgi:tetratricopeptide (TPR) repeat protein
MSRRPARSSVPRRRGGSARRERAGDVALVARPAWRVRRLGVIVLGGLVVALGAGLIVALRMPESPEALRLRADAAARAGHWDAALRDWRAVNRSKVADARSHLAEARAALALARAAQAEHALEQASRLDPGDPEPWLILLEIARVEGRPVDAVQIGRRALAGVPAPRHREILRALTLALLADAPDELARATLARWIAADPDDLDARAALGRRMTENPRADDPPVARRLAELESMLAAHPGHVGLREALVLALAEAGDPARGRAVLDGWPETARDARYDRLRGRWDLEYPDPSRPAREQLDDAVVHLRRALGALPHDWKSRYRMARALQALGRGDAARRAAGEVARLREVLEPVRLGRRLDAALEHLDDPAARRDLAALCAEAGLDGLADAWRADANAPAPTPGNAAGSPHTALPEIPPGPRTYSR